MLKHQSGTGQQKEQAGSSLHYSICNCADLLYCSSVRMQLDSRKFDILWILGLLLVTVMVFWPAATWIARQTLEHEQLRQSFFLLLFAAAVLWIDHRSRLRFQPAISRKGVVLLTLAFALLTAGFFWHTALIPLAALAVAFAACIHFVFGDRGFNLTMPWLAGFGAFLFFMLLFQAVDWPLRKLAGGYAAQLLALLGHEVRIGAILHSGIKLLLWVDGRYYEVATECNGFGLISSSVILALLLMLSRPLGLAWKALALAVAFLVGFAFNILRIIGIVSLAPYFPGHYDLMHEAIGLTALFSALFFLWWLLGDFGKTSERVAPDREVSTTVSEIEAQKEKIS